jgi:hypothetical protein
MKLRLHSPLCKFVQFVSLSSGQSSVASVAKEEVLLTKEDPPLTPDLEPPPTEFKVIQTNSNQFKP